MTVDVHQTLIWTKPHVVVEHHRLRICLKMLEGRWVLGTYSTMSPLEVEMLGVLHLPQFEAAVRWMDTRNAKLAMDVATKAIDKVMSK